MFIYICKFFKIFLKKIYIIKLKIFEFVSIYEYLYIYINSLVSQINYLDNPIIIIYCIKSF